MGRGDDGEDRWYVLDPVFQLCLFAAARERELLAEYDRLRGTNLGGRGTVVERLVDEATGRLESDVAGFVEFVEFVREQVYGPLVAARAEFRGKEE